LLRYLATATPYQRKQLLCISRQQIDAISEISFNLLHGNIEISDGDFARLSRHKNTLRKLSIKSVGHCAKCDQMCKDSNGIKSLIQVFLKHYNNCTDSETSFSGDEDWSRTNARKPELSNGRDIYIPLAEGTFNNNDNGRSRSGLSKIDTDSPDPVLTAHSKTSTANKSEPTATVESRFQSRITELFTKRSRMCRRLMEKTQQFHLKRRQIRLST
jgi:hypothetical protein